MVGHRLVKVPLHDFKLELASSARADATRLAG